MKNILTIKEVNTDTYEIESIGVKEIYAPNSNSASKWIREEVNGIKRIDSPPLTNSISYNQFCKQGSRISKKAIGCFLSNSNNVNENTTCVALFSGSITKNAGLSILSENYKKVVALFTARKTITPTWINCKDEYFVPNTEHQDYLQWNNDAIIYSLFNNSSQQSSLRNIDYKDKKWDIINNFFFMSNEEMKELANNNNFNSMYQDAKTFGEDRFVYNILQETTLSPDAQEILDLAKDLIRKSFSMRIVYNDNNPKYHLSSWDAGWAQLKPMFKEYFKEDYTAFVVKYKEFENRMREGVYKFGFLKE